MTKVEKIIDEVSLASEACVDKEYIIYARVLDQIKSGLAGGGDERIATKLGRKIKEIIEDDGHQAAN
jgi:hypothetical protein